MDEKCKNEYMKINKGRIMTRVFDYVLLGILACFSFQEGHTQVKTKALKKERQIKEKVKYLKKVERLKFFVRTGIPGFNFEGHLKKKLAFHKKNSRLHLSIPPWELTTDLSLRDRHMREKILKKKDIQFLGIVKCRHIKCTATGKLTIGNEEKKLKFSLKKTGKYLKMSYKLKLSDFSIDPPEFMGVKVDNEIVIVAFVR